MRTERGLRDRHKRRRGTPKTVMSELNRSTSEHAQAAVQLGSKVETTNENEAIRVPTEAGTSRLRRIPSDKRRPREPQRGRSPMARARRKRGSAEPST